MTTKKQSQPLAPKAMIFKGRKVLFSPTQQQTFYHRAAMKGITPFEAAMKHCLKFDGLLEYI